MTDASKEWLFIMKDIENRFTYHQPTPEKTRMYEHLRYLGKDLAEAICERCPGGRERALALTKLEEAIFWANAGIARGV